MMKEVYDAKIIDNHVHLLLREEYDAGWVKYDTLRRVQYKVKLGILPWIGKGNPPEWWQKELSE